jgi:hypothetical protein
MLLALHSFYLLYWYTRTNTDTASAGFANPDGAEMLEKIGMHICTIYIMYIYIYDIYAYIYYV